MIAPTLYGSRFSTGRLEAIEDFTLSTMVMSYIYYLITVIRYSLQCQAVKDCESPTPENQSIEVKGDNSGR